MECDVVFLALHPQALLAELPCLTRVRSDALVVSLAPRVTLDEISAQLRGMRRIVRLIPNAPASIGDGFNPMSHSPSLSRLEVDEIRTFLSMLGDTPIVAEDELEAWAVITGMAPTYFWFQMLHLQQLATEFGLDETEARRGISETVMGAARMLGQSWLVPEEVLDLVPIHPLREDEARIRATFDQRLYAMYERMAAQAMAAV
jgi:pyrroline-5-carboxylate reductase